MKIVIEMPEEDYRRLKDDKYNEHPDSALRDLEILVNAFHNGIPLPKGHGRLIDADKIMRVDHIVLESTIDDAPTIIESADKKADKE